MRALGSVVLLCSLFASSCGVGLAQAALPPAAALLETETLEVQLDDPERPSLQLRFPYANPEARLGYGGVQLWARPERDEILVSAIVDAPAKSPRWERCEGAWLAADGRRVALETEYIARPMDGGIYEAVQLGLGIHQLRRLVRARRIAGAVCGDPIELTDSQRRSLARFVALFDELAQPRQSGDAPGFRAVGPEIELLPHEDPDPGPYEA